MTDALVQRLRDALRPPYEIQRELGGGAMSRVFVAQEQALRRLVVVKVLPLELAAAVSAERFRQEVRLLARLQHPNIVPLLTAGEVPDLHGPGTAGEYYVMPFVEGQTLRGHMRRTGRLPVPETISLLRDIARALKYAHEKGVVHRDIKPENILLAGGAAIVTDFGIAKAVAASALPTPGADPVPTGDLRLTLAGMVLGTPLYVAPEQAAGDLATDHRADLYALGVLAWEMLAGRPPFMADTAQELIRLHIVEKAEPLHRVRDDVPGWLADLVDRLLAKRPDERPETASAVVRALEHGAPRASIERQAVALQRRRTVRSAVWAAAGATAIATAWLAASARDAPAEVNAHRVLVAALENRTGRPDLELVGGMASDWIARQIMQTGLADVMPAGQLDVANPTQSAQRLARSAGAGTVIEGRYYLVPGDTLRFELQLLDGRSGKLLRALEPVNAPSSALQQGLSVLQQRVAGGLAALLDTAFASYASPEASPAFPAYVEFVQAQNIYWGARRPRTEAALDSAVMHFRRAAALDSNFHTATLWIAVASSVRNRCDVADSVTRALAPRRDRLVRWDQLFYDLVVSRCRGDWRSALQVSEQRLRAFPHSTHVRYLLSVYAVFANHPRRALHALDSLDPSRDLYWVPGPESDLRFWDQRIQAHWLLQQYDTALVLARHLSRAHPRNSLAWTDHAVALALSGHSAELGAKMDSAFDQAAPGTTNEVRGALLRVARVLAAFGHDSAARSVAERLMRSAQLFNVQESEEVELLELAHRWQDASALAERRLRRAPADLDLVRIRGRLAARLGERKLASALDARLAKWEGPFLLGQPELIRAEMAAVLGERDRAVAHLAEFVRRGGGSAARGPWLVLRHSPALASLHGHPGFEALLRPLE